MIAYVRLVAAALLLVTAAACAQTAPTTDAPRSVDTSEPQQIVFSRDVQPLLQDKFAPLLADEPGLRLDTWEQLMAGSDHGGVLIPFDPERSLLVKLATRLPADHPLRPAADDITQGELSVVRSWIEAGAPNDAGEIAYADAGPLLYVANQGAAVISVIDMERNLVARTVDLQELGFSANAKPHHIVVEPDGSHWYVSLIGENRVLKFDRANELVGQATLEVPGMLALDPTSDRLWVGRSMSAVNPPRRVGLVDRTDMSVEEIDVFFPRPHALAVTSDGAYTFSGSLAQNQIASIDGETMDVELTTVDGPTHTFVQFALAPDGGTMVAGGQVSNELLFFDTGNPAQPVLVDTLDVEAQPWHPLFTPDGRFIYFGNKGTHSVTVVDADERSVAQLIRGNGIAQPHGSGMRPDGRYVYISNNNLDGSYTPRYPVDDTPVGTVVVIDTQTQEVAKVLEVEQYPSGVGSPAAP